MSARHARLPRKNARYIRPSGSVIPPQPQPSVLTEDGTRTLRQRQHGNRNLPLPPLMDPIVLAAREKYTQPKAEVVEEELTDFQRELAMNPFGA